MNTFWKIILTATVANGLVGVYADYRQNKVLRLLTANATCQEAHITLNYQLLMAVASDQIPDQPVDIASACAERDQLIKEYQPDAVELPEDEENSQVPE